MANVRELFPTLERFRRVRRGSRPQKAWTKAPSFEQLAGKLAPTILDTHARAQTVPGRPPTELRRLLLRSGNRFGYACLKSQDFPVERCKTYDDLQAVFSNMEKTIRWCNTYAQLIEWLGNHCTSPAYVERAKKVRV